MKRLPGKILLSAAVLLLSLSVWGQKRIYTRSFMIQDFKSKTTKVVLDESNAFNAALRQEITSLWTVSPYEFCTKAEYDKQKNSPDCYFLHAETEKDIVFLTLSRGGKEDDADALKRPVTVLSIPVSGTRDTSGRSSVYMPAFISLMQDFTEAAMNSEMVAYQGLKAIKTKAPKDLRIYTDPDEAADAFLSNYEGSAVQLIISADGSSAGKPRYKMVIGTSGYELYSYGKN